MECGSSKTQRRTGGLVKDFGDCPMTVVQLRKKIAAQLKDLSEDRLRAACHFVEFLHEAKDSPATSELLQIKGFRSALRRAEREAAAGKTVSLSKVRRDV